MNCRHLLGFLTLFIGVNTHVFSQAVITGTVLDDLGDPAIGATVVDESISPPRGTTTDFDGKYRLEVPEGTYTLKFSYIGLGDKSVTDIVASPGEVTFLDVSLEESSTDLAEVVVTAAAIERTENALIKIRQGSDKILDGISSQEMSKLALSNAAGAMTKVTGTTVVDGKYIVVRGLGDRYSTAQLNGLTMPSSDPYRNSPQLDLVPANLLDNIQTSKTFTPDQSGAFTGGNVDLKTKAFPEIKTFTVSVGAGYNTQSLFNDDFKTYRGGNTDWLGYDDGTRALPERLVEIGNLEVPAGRGSTGSVNVLSNSASRLNTTDEANTQAYELLEEASNVLPLDFSTQRSTPTLNHNIGVSYGNSHDLSEGKRFGYLFSGVYSRNFQHYSNGTTAFYQLTDPNATGLNVNYDLRDTTSVENPVVSGFGSFGFKFAEGQTITANVIYNHDASIGARQLAGTAPALNLSPTQELQNRTLTFLERSTMTSQVNGEHALNTAGDFRLEWSTGYTVTTQNEPNRRLLAAIVDYKNPDAPTYQIPSASISRPLNFFRDLRDDQWETKLDLFKEFEGGHKLQGGLAYRSKERTFEERIYELRVVQRNINIEFNGNTDEYFSDSNLGFGPLNRGGVGAINYVVDNTTPANSYDGRENILAGYLMGTYKINDKLRTIVGARAEHTDLESVSRDDTQPDSIRIGSILGTDILPSVNLVYSPAERHNVRASFTQTIARPNMREIARFPSYDFIGGPTFSGNPNLVRTHIDNYDLRYEFFPTAGALLSVSAFYKEFTDPIVSTFLPAQQLEFTYVNVPSATVYGLEFEARSDLGFISESLAELKAGANFSLIESEADINPVELARIRTFVPDFKSTRDFQGQSPYIVNGNLSWAPERFGFEAALAYNIFGDRLAFNGDSGTPDVYERARGSLDVSVSRNFGPVGVRLTATNLLNPSYETYATYEGQDFIYTQYKRGQNVNLSLGYTFGS